MAVGSPDGSRALTRVNSDNVPSSRRKSLAAVKEEAALAGKAHKENKDKENMAMAKESMETQKESVAAMMDANDNARKSGGNEEDGDDQGGGDVYEEGRGDSGETSQKDRRAGKRERPSGREGRQCCSAAGCAARRGV